MNSYILKRIEQIELNNYNRSRIEQNVIKNKFNAILYKWIEQN